MVCIHCTGITAVINSRPQKRLNQVWRRRKCLDCAAIFSTHEVAQYENDWIVRNSDEQVFKPFLRDKLFLSLYSSCQHRPTALIDAGALSETIISKLISYAENGMLDSRTIAQIAQVALSRFDKAASTHYQAFHKN